MSTRFSLVGFSDGVRKYNWLCKDDADFAKMEAELIEIVRDFVKTSSGSIWPQVNALQLVAERVEQDVKI
jgi:hypothetical protein